jgi:Rv0078B-related antitoxin
VQAHSIAAHNETASLGLSLCVWYIVSAMGEDRLDPRRIEVIDDDMARVLQAKTGAERLAIGFAMFSSARRMLISHLRDQHPDWSEEEVLREAAHRLSHGAV